ncbi:MAG: class I SAM-dependent methyltransferase [Ignavibacteria bacterium]|nr:class I SAM-dependent methyltransferase [Ignavibacteria bacterium]
MNPPYSDNYLNEYYSAYIIDEPEWEKPLICGHNFYLSIIETYENKGRLLDIGAGKGYLLEAALSRGWKAEGYDVDEELTERLRNKYKIRVLDGDFTSLDLGSEQYDAVTMHQVIEHLKDPVPYIKKIHDILKPRGTLFLAQPNIRSRSSSFKFALEKMGIRKKNIGAYYDTDHHLFYYTPRTLKNFVERFGFELLHNRSGHRVKPGQSNFNRFIHRNLDERFLGKSTFLAIFKKKESKV